VRRQAPTSSGNLQVDGVGVAVLAAGQERMVGGVTNQGAGPEVLRLRGLGRPRASGTAVDLEEVGLRPEEIQEPRAHHSLLQHFDEAVQRVRSLQHSHVL
jgi:hypothetical protein